MLIKDIPEYIVEALENRGFNHNEICAMDPQRMFDEYCNWEGLINYGPNLWRTVQLLSSLLPEE